MSCPDAAAGARLVRIRPAEERDLPALSEFGLALARGHVELDARRFVVPGGGAQAYLEFFSRELERRETTVLIAEDRATAVGYAFVRMEPASFEALCEPSAWLHDVYVEVVGRSPTDSGGRPFPLLHMKRAGPA